MLTEVTQETGRTRRSERPIKLKVFHDYVTYMAETEEVIFSESPVSVTEALSRHDGNKWQQDMEDELKSLADNQSWNLVELPSGSSVVGCKWIFKIKSDCSHYV